MRRHTASLLALLLLTAAAPSQSDDARRQAEAAEAARKAALAARDAASARAAQAAQAGASLAAERTRAMAKLREAEAATLQSADRLADLTRDQQAAQGRLDTQAAALAPLLPLIERLSLYPAETLLAVPESTDNAIRGLLVLRGISRQLEAEAAALRAEQGALVAARAAVAAEMPRLAAAEHAQQEAARELDQHIAVTDADRRKAEAQSTANDRRAAELAARADSLRALVASLDGQQRALARREQQGSRRHGHTAPPSGDDTPVRGSGGLLLVPVTGTVVRAWGAPTDAGPAAGVSYRAAPNAQVLSPCSGKVAFAAPFRSYGKLVIMDCGGGTAAVLAGIARLDVHAGQSVHRGDTVGAMPDWNPANQGDRPTLYVELRRKGEPVNPAPLMKAS